MWSVLKNDLRDFVSTVTSDTKEVINTVMRAGEGEDYTHKEGTERQKGTAGTVPPEVVALQGNPATYLEAVPEQDEAAWGAFVQTFDLANKATEMERVLKHNPDMSSLHAELVGETQQLSSELFWTRYFFKVERLSVKGPLRLDLGGDEEEDLSWGDDDDEEEEEEGPNDTETDKGSVPLSSQAEGASPSGTPSTSTQAAPASTSAEAPKPPPRQTKEPPPGSVSSTPGTPGYPRMSEVDQVAALSRDIVNLHARLRELEEQNATLTEALSKEQETVSRLQAENEALRGRGLPPPAPIQSRQSPIQTKADAASNDDEAARDSSSDKAQVEREVLGKELPAMERSFSNDAVRIEPPVTVVEDEEEDELTDDWS